MNIKIDKIRMGNALTFNASHYPKSIGLFLVEDAAGAIDKQVVWVNNSVVTFLCWEKEIKTTTEEIKEKAKSDVSEELFLKALSLVINKDESYK